MFCRRSPSLSLSLLPGPEITIAPMPRRPTRPLALSRCLLLASMSALLSLSLLFLSLSSTTPPPTSPTTTHPPSHILRACRATRFPSSCLSTLSHSPNLPSNPTPSELILAALAASSHSLNTAQSMAQSILSSSSDPDRSTAARNCLDHLSLSALRLSAAAAHALPLARLADARAWASAALLYQYDCWSSLKYVNSTAQVSRAMHFLYDLAHVTSNALSMLAALQRFGPNMNRWAPPQTERDGYWPNASGAHGLRFHGGLPRNLKPDITVCHADHCDHRSVQAAVDAAPDYSEDHFVIHIKAGIYQETVRIPFKKTNVILLGDGIGRTIITSSLNTTTPGISTYNTATIGVMGDGFMAANLTLENAAGAGAHQAVAFMSDSDHSVLESVEIRGHQDTLYARSLRHLYRSCHIAGTVDFIFGNAAAMFDDCLILVVPRLGSREKGETNAVTAHGRTDPAQSTGFVFHNCVINGSEEYVALYHKKPTVHRNYLGRPWKEYSRTVFVDCHLGPIVRPEGWLPWRGEFALKTLFYGEFGSTGPGANATERVKWSKQIPVKHLAAYSVENFIQGDEWIPSYKLLEG